ncbi:MAG: CARDB domain-containing protein, partial [Dehalococcoidia bacterium]
SAAVTTLPITITPTSGLPYTAVAISGGGFTANTDGSVTVASITFGGVAATDVVGSIDTGGRLAATCTVPAVTGGSKTVTITDSSSVAKSTTWTVLAPTVTLSPTTGPVGSTVTVSGTNFVPGDGITITLAATTAPASVSATGTFSGEIVVPSTAAVGSNTVTAADTTGNSKTAVFTVPTAAVSVSPSSGVLGATATVSGTGFPAHSPVTVAFMAAITGMVDVTPSPSPVVGPTGTVTASFSVPGGQAGSAIVAITAGGVTAAATFTVVVSATPTPAPAGAGTIRVSPRSGQPGSAVAVRGSGFPAHSTVFKIEFTDVDSRTVDVTPLPNLRIGSDGNVTIALIVPDAPVGAAFVLLAAGGVSAGTTFSVVAPPTPTPVATPTPTPTPTPVATPTPTPAPTPTPGMLDLRGGIDESGVVSEALELTSEDGGTVIRMLGNTTALSLEGAPLEAIEVRLVYTGSVPPPDGYVVGGVYEMLPQGATFEPPVEIVLTYDQALLPEGVSAEDLVMVSYDVEPGWQELVSASVLPTVTAQVGHFTHFAILVGALGPPPEAFRVSNLNISPAEVGVEEPVTVSVEGANRGQEESSFKTKLKINGVVEQLRVVTLAAGANTTISFTVLKDIAGTYVAEIAGQRGEFVVVPLPPANNRSMIIGVSVILAVIGAGMIFLAISRRRDLAG